VRRYEAEVLAESLGDWKFGNSGCRIHPSCQQQC